MTPAAVGIALVITCGAMEGVAQIFFKKSALDAARKALWVAAGVAVFVVQAVVYTGALQFVEVSTALPVTSISFAIVAILSQRFLGEPVSGTRWTGIALIVAGVALLSVQA
jgi:drug/metabolite transporter (DMT)-like permease